jgi:hypothetical protein
MNDETKAFLDFIEAISDMNVERDWRLVAPRLLELGDAYVASIPWHKRLRFRIRSRISSAWVWFDWWVIIRVTAFIQVMWRSK